MTKNYNLITENKKLNYSRLFSTPLLIMLFIMIFGFQGFSQSTVGYVGVNTVTSVCSGSIDIKVTDMISSQYYTLFRLDKNDNYYKVGISYQYISGSNEYTIGTNISAPGKYVILSSATAITTGNFAYGATPPNSATIISGNVVIYATPIQPIITIAGVQDVNYTYVNLQDAVFCSNPSLSLATETTPTGIGSQWAVSYKIYQIDEFGNAINPGNDQTFTPTAGVPTTSYTFQGLAAGLYRIDASRNGCSVVQSLNTQSVLIGTVENTNPSHNLCYSLIQDAIDATNTVTGDILSVKNNAIGYTENVNINKAITLQAVDPSVDVFGTIDIAANNVTLQDFEYVWSFLDYGVKVKTGSTGYTIQNIQGISADAFYGLTSLNGIDIEPGAGSGTIQAVGLSLNKTGINIGALSNGAILTITGNDFGGVQYGTGYVGINNDAIGVTISNNVFHEVNTGILNTNNNTQITGNNFDLLTDGGTAIDNIGTGVVASGNSFGGSLIVNNIAITSIEALTAIHNWFGSAKGPTVASNPCGDGWSVSDLVGLTYEPWYGDAAMTALNYVSKFTSVYASQVDNLCFGASDGSITLATNGGVLPYEFSTDNGATWSSAMIGLAAGTYTVKAKDANGCEVDVPFDITHPLITITEPDVLDAQYVYADESCYNMDDGTITVSAPTGGFGNYEVSIDNFSSLLTTFEVSTGTPYVFSSLTPGSYTLKIRDKDYPTCVITLTTSSIGAKSQISAPTATSLQESTYDGVEHTATALQEFSGSENLVWFTTDVAGGSITTSAPHLTNVGSSTAWVASQNTTTLCYSSRVEVTLTVNKKLITISGTTISSRAYNATTTAGTVNPGTLSGVENGETLTVNGLGSDYSSKNIGTYPSTVTYTVTDGTGLAANYTGIASESVNGTINKLDVTLTGAANTKTYDGDATAAAIPTLTVGSLQGSDVAVYSETYDNKNQGTNKTMTPSVVSIVDGSSADMTGNYNVTIDPTTNGTINKLDVTGSFTADNKDYDGNTSAIVLTRTANDVISPDVVNLTGGTATFSDKNVGTGKTVTLTGASLTGADAGNYNLTSVGTTTANISAKPLSITAEPKNKAYDGYTYENSSSFTVVYSGWLPGDDETHNDFIGTLNFNGCAAHTATAIGQHTITPQGVTSVNYNISFIDGTLTITGTRGIYGQVKYFKSTTNANNIPINNVTLKLYDGATLLATTISSTVIDPSDPYNGTTSVDGYYEFPNTYPTGNYTVVASTTKPWLGVNATDAMLIKLHTINLLPALPNGQGRDFQLNTGIPYLTNLPLLAGNVNLVTSVNATDALLIQLRTIGKNTSFAAGDWVFDNTSAFAVTQGVEANHEILALAVGDVNSSYPVLLSSTKTTNYTNLQKEGISTVNTSSDIEVPVRVSDLLSVGAITLDLSYDNKLIDVKGLTSQLNGLEYNINNGKINVAWSDINPVLLQANDVLFTLVVRAKGTINSSDNLFSYTDNTEFADGQGNVIHFSNLKVNSIETNNSANSINVFPNPFKNNIDIDYTLVESGSVTLSIYNAIGQKVSVLVDENKTAGSYKFNFNTSELPSGVYSCEIIVNGQTSKYSKVIKLVKAN